MTSDLAAPRPPSGPPRRLPHAGKMFAGLDERSDTRTARQLREDVGRLEREKAELCTRLGLSQSRAKELKEENTQLAQNMCVMLKTVRQELKRKELQHAQLTPSARAGGARAHGKSAMRTPSAQRPSDVRLQPRLAAGDAGRGPPQRPSNAALPAHQLPEDARRGLPVVMSAAHTDRGPHRPPSYGRQPRRDDAANVGRRPPPTSGRDRDYNRGDERSGPPW